MVLTVFNIARLGYILIGGAVAGYFGYYLPNKDAFIWEWLIMGILGLICLAYKNSQVSNVKRLKAIGLDILFMIILPLIASIPLPYGLSIVLMAVIAGLLVYGLIKYALNPWHWQKQNK
ncbi:hypothetical protein GCM10028778_07320 [Barrientosiimonas marina]|uniref:Uncharacterized protein n=1 Tax=Lentibacillus kimchii TaxID=1542911 RepID=A0ABW2UWQ2_9BACI